MSITKINENMSNKNAPQVCLLMGHLEDAQNLAGAFKQMGVHPFFINSLEEWWKESLTKNISLTIVDILLASSEDKFISDHPKVQAGQSLLAFFYTGESAPLLHSTANLFHLGHIQKSPFYDYQLRPILIRANHFNEAIAENNKKENKLLELENRNIELIENHHQLMANAIYLNKCKEWIQIIMELNKRLDFVEAIADWCEEENDILEVGIVEISDNGQKLISRPLKGKKYSIIPSLWPGSNCSLGMDFMAQSLATQVAVEMFGPDVVPLFLSLQNKVAKIGIFLKVSKETAQFVPWKWLEQVLSMALALESYVKMQFIQDLATSHNKTVGISESHFSINLKTPFDILSLLDKLFASLEEEQKKWACFLLDLSFIEQILDQRQVQFFYKSFFYEVLHRLKSFAICDITVAPFDGRFISLVLNKEEGAFLREFDLLKDLFKQFPYYKYFENPDSLLARSMVPELYGIPLSSIALKLKMASLNQTSQGSHLRMTPHLRGEITL